MADFGSHSIPYFFRRTLDVDSTREVYVLVPASGLAQYLDSGFSLKLLPVVSTPRLKFPPNLPSLFSRTARADGFATALGAGFDWRFTPHLSWRIVQADYLGTNLSSQWQSDFRASTSIVYSFGRP